MASSERKKVLLAVDRSDNARQAFEFYAHNLHQSTTELILLHCAELSNVSARLSKGDPPPYEDWKKVWDAEQREIESLKSKYLDKAKDHQVEHVRFEVRYSNKPGEAIVDVARTEHVDHIVTGTRGLGKIRRTILGSVSEYLVHHAPCPVVVCRQ